MKKAAVIGGGASGLMAALSASELYRTVVFEKNERTGRKLAQTGNGRCNLTNEAAGSGHYYGNDFVEGALMRFGPEDTLRYMEGIGLLARREYGGRYYSFSGQAGSVVDALRFALEKKGVELRTGTRVTGVEKKDERFTVRSEKGEETFDYVIVCCGSMAAEKLGGCSDGLDILRSLGHRVIKPVPALVPVMTDNTYTRMLKGVRVQGKATLMGEDGTPVRAALGDILFTDYGISGPAVMDVSRFCTGHKGLRIETDMFPDMDEADLEELLKKMTGLRETAGELFTGLLNNKLSVILAKYCGIEPGRKAAELSSKDALKLAHAAKNMSFDVKGTTGFPNAQTVRGGALTGQFDQNTLESLIVKGLFAAGEVLDVDGECGGFNLQWAWSSGYVAGRCGR